MKKEIISFVCWVALWMGFAWLLSLTHVSEWGQGAWTAGLTFIVHRVLFDKSNHC